MSVFICTSYKKVINLRNSDLDQYPQAEPPRTMRTLPSCLTFDKDPQIFKSFERNTVQVVWGDPFEKTGGGGTVGSGSAALGFEGGYPRQLVCACKTA